MSVRMLKVIETLMERRGQGVPGSPIRIIRQYWSLDGDLLAEHDPTAYSLLWKERGEDGPGDPEPLI